MPKFKVMYDKSHKGQGLTCSKEMDWYDMVVIDGVEKGLKVSDEKKLKKYDEIQAHKEYLGDINNALTADRITYADLTNIPTEPTQYEDMLRNKENLHSKLYDEGIVDKSGKLNKKYVLSKKDFDKLQKENKKLKKEQEKLQKEKNKDDGDK